MPRRLEPDKDEPVSLAPLDFEEAVRALLAVDPESEPVEEREPDKPNDSARP